MDDQAAEGAEPSVSNMREEGAEGGFTLIELMVVLLIMAILMAIAVPTFLGVRTGAQDRSVQSDLVNSGIAAKSLFATNGTFAPIASQLSQLQNEEPELSYVTGIVTMSPAHQVSVGVTPDDKILFMTAQSPAGRCWTIEVNEESTPTNDGISYLTPNQGVSFSGTFASLGARLYCSPTSTTFGAAVMITWGPSFPN